MDKNYIICHLQIPKHNILLSGGGRGGGGGEGGGEGVGEGGGEGGGDFDGSGGRAGLWW